MIGFSQFSRHWQSGGVPSRCCCLRCSGRGDRQGFKRAGPNQMTNVAGRGGAWRGVAERGRNGEGGDGDAPVVYINTGRHRAQWLASPCLAPRRVSAPPPRWHAAGTTRPGKQISEIFHGFSSRLPPAELFVLGAAPPVGNASQLFAASRLPVSGPSRPSQFDAPAAGERKQDGRRAVI